MTNPLEPRPKGSGRTLLKSLALLVPTITAIAVAVPVIVNWGERSSGTDTIVLVTDPSTPSPTTPTSPSASQPGEYAPTVAENIPTEVGTDTALNDPYANVETIGTTDGSFWDNDNWLVPVSAPFLSFPDNGAEGNIDGCTAEQLAWLEGNAFPHQHSDFFDLTLQNNASTGAALSLDNIRFVGEEIPSQAWVFLECPHGGKGNGGGSQPIEVDTDGTTAVWGDTLYDENPHPVGSPVTLNLSPGEVAQVTFARADRVDTQRAYQGRFVADVAGSDSSVVLADDIEFIRAELPDYFLGWGANYSSLHCGTPVSTVPCEIEEAAQLLSSLADGLSGS